jgi:AcrR family transcriptional regulator
MIVSESSAAPLDPIGDALSQSALRRVPRSQATRRRLLDAGRSLFAELGLHGVTSHAIAEKAGYASGTFYIHFKDKLALFRELADEAAIELEGRLHSVSQGKTDPVEVMQAQAEALVSFAEDQRDLLRIIFHPGAETGEIGSKILEHLAQGVSARRREAVANGRARDCFDPDVLAQAIVGMWAHVLAWWAEDPSRAGRDEIIQTLTHFQLHGNRAEPGALCGLPVGRAPSSQTPPAGDPSR